MLSTERHRVIQEWLRQEPSLRTSELKERLQVSEVTIRNDLRILEQHGLVRRVHGGVVSVNTEEIALRARESSYQDEKARIGAAAAELIAPGDTVLLDAGSTTIEVAKHLPPDLPCTIITHSPLVALQVLSYPHVEVILIGGMLHKVIRASLGPDTVRALKKLHVNKLFLSVAAVHPENGLTDNHVLAAEIKRTMLQVAQHNILLTDSSKWGKTLLMGIAPLASVHTIITDDGIPSGAPETLRAQGFDVRLV